MAAVPSHRVIAADAEHDHEKGALRLAEQTRTTTRIKPGTTEPRLEGRANMCVARLVPRRFSVTQLLFELSCYCKCVLTVGERKAQVLEWKAPQQTETRRSRSTCHVPRIRHPCAEKTA